MNSLFTQPPGPCPASHASRSIQNGWRTTLALFTILAVLRANVASGAEINLDSIFGPRDLDRAPWQRLGISVVGPIPEFSCPLPPSKREAVRRWVTEFAWPENGLHVHPQIAAAQIAEAPIRALIGATVGVGVGLAESKRQAAAAAVQDAQVTVADRTELGTLFAEAARIRRSMTLVQQDIPPDAEPFLSWENSLAIRRKSGADLGRVGTAPAAVKAVQTFPVSNSLTSPNNETDCDAYLEIAVLQHGLHANPPRWHISICGAKIGSKGSAHLRLGLQIAWHVRLIRVSDGAELWSIYPRYDGGDFRITKWTTEGGRVLQSELRHAYAELGERVSAKLQPRPSDAALASHSAER